jgi:hypothetical protein
MEAADGKFGGGQRMVLPFFPAGAPGAAFRFGFGQGAFNELLELVDGLASSRFLGNGEFLQFG